MDYEFDTEKDSENRRKHGVSLTLGRVVIESMINEKIDLDSGGEERWVAYGFASGRLMVCVYTMRASRCAEQRAARSWNAYHEDYEEHVGA
jgi:uncharacterized DUF497 family protein